MIKNCIFCLTYSHTHTHTHTHTHIYIYIYIDVISFIRDFTSSEVTLFHVQCTLMETNIVKSNGSTRSTKIWIRETYIGNPEIYEIGSGTKLFITFLSLRFFDMRRERHTISFYADFSIWTPPRASPPPQTTGMASVSSKNRLPSPRLESHLQLTQQTRSARSAQSRLASPRSESQLTGFFSNPPNPQRFRAWRHSGPRSHNLSEFFFCDISDCHIRPAHVWTPALNLCT